MRLLSICLAVVVLLPALTTVCNAELIEVTFEGNLTFVSSSPPLATRFSLGDLMQVSIIYESSCPDERPLDSNTGVYDCIQSFSVSVDSTIPYSATSTTGRWGTRYDYFSYDAILAYLWAPGTMPPPGAPDPTLDGPDVAGLPLWMFKLNMYDSTGNALSSDALPTSFNPSEFDNNFLELSWREITSHGTFNRDIRATDFTSTSRVVPLPGAVLLGMIGLSVAGLKLRKSA